LLSAIRTTVLVVWLVFAAYWFIAAFSSKPGARSLRGRTPRLIIVVVVVVLRVVRPRGLVVHLLALQIVGLVVFLAGLTLAVWARFYLGRNWGMPMDRKEEPELVTSGPYRFIRHPIYSGLLLGVLGTTLTTNLYVLIALAVLGAYFVYSARVEERLMTASFPSAYPEYRAKTKMLIPFVF
jgi:protein-S-isoprenylcysteine O-methyltransferase Ste14